MSEQPSRPSNRPSQFRQVPTGGRGCGVDASSPVPSVSPSVPPRSTAARAIDSPPPPRPPRREARRPISVSSCDVVRASGTVRSQLAPPSARRFTRSSSSIATARLQTHRAFPSATTVTCPWTVTDSPGGHLQQRWRDVSTLFTNRRFVDAQPGVVVRRFRTSGLTRSQPVRLYRQGCVRPRS